MDIYNSRGVSSKKEDVHEAIKNLDKGLFPNAFFVKYFLILWVVIPPFVILCTRIPLEQKLL